MHPLPRQEFFKITDHAMFDAAVVRLRAAEAAKGVAVFAIGVGPDADMVKLKELSARRDPLRLDGLKFQAFFHWLSASLNAASQSGAHGANDSAIGANGQQVALPAATSWATVD